MSTIVRNAEVGDGPDPVRAREAARLEMEIPFLDTVVDRRLKDILPAQQIALQLAWYSTMDAPVFRRAQDGERSSGTRLTDFARRTHGYLNQMTQLIGDPITSVGLQRLLGLHELDADAQAVVLDYLAELHARVRDKNVIQEALRLQKSQRRGKPPWHDLVQKLAEIIHWAITAENARRVAAIPAEPRVTLPNTAVPKLLAELLALVNCPVSPPTIRNLLRRKN